MDGKQLNNFVEHTSVAASVSDMGALRDNYRNKPVVKLVLIK